jgi:hypothetical protein
VPCVPEGVEDCNSCFDAMGRCCYGDSNWGAANGTLDLLVARCTALPSCMACCNECKQLDCATLKKRGMCPNLGPTVDGGMN